MDLIKYNQKLKQRSRDLRNKSTLSERMLWNYLKGKKLGFLFNRQRPINNYIVDFYCSERKLVIEIDGEIHNDTKQEDGFRQKELESFGITFLRFSDKEVEKFPKVVVAKIVEALKILP